MAILRVALALCVLALLSACGYVETKQASQQAAYDEGEAMERACRILPSTEETIVCFQNAMTQLAAAAPQTTMFFFELTNSLLGSIRNGEVDDAAARTTFEDIQRETLAVAQIEGQAIREARQQELSNALWNSYQILRQTAPAPQTLSFTNCQQIGPRSISCIHH